MGSRAQVEVRAWLGVWTSLSTVTEGKGNKWAQMQGDTVVQHAQVLFGLFLFSQ